MPEQLVSDADHLSLARLVVEIAWRIADSRKRYDDVQSGWRDGKYKDTDRNLMIDGLMKQFIGQVDET